MKNKLINLIVAHDSNLGISKLGRIPWSNKTDIDFFKRITSNVTNIGMMNGLIVGSNTFKYFNKTKIGVKRKIYLVSRDKKNYQQNENPNVVITKSVSEAIQRCNSDNLVEKIFICSNIGYQHVISNNLIDKMYITDIYDDYYCDNHIIPYHDLGFDNISTIIKDNRFEITERFKLYNENNDEQNYLNLLKHILIDGCFRKTRNSSTYSLFGKSLSFDLSKGFPLLTTKNMYYKGVAVELIDLFLKGKTDTNILIDKGVNIWKLNTSKEFLDSRNLNYKVGEMGPMYGYQWRHYGSDYNSKHDHRSVDQLKNVIDLISNDPMSRRILMTTYNPLDSPKSVLDPCHGLITQFYVSKKDDNYVLNCQTYQRSADMFLGVPFNIASYALLMHILCTLCKPDNKKIYPGILTLNIGDAHIYTSHITSVKKQIDRKPLPFPKLSTDSGLLNLVDDIYLNCYASTDNLIKIIDDNIIESNSFKIVNYMSYDKLKEEMIP